MSNSATLLEKAKWVRRETLRLHKYCPETRVASSLSAVEIFVALYYGGVLRHDPVQPRSRNRDRLIISKGHGGVSLYPVLADKGFFDLSQLDLIGRPGSTLGAIPGAQTPGIETTNGSLGHGLGVACGMALALRHQNNDAKVFVLAGDGELNCGAVWEAVMFAAFQRLGNIILVVDNNGKSMLGLQHEILGLDLLVDKFHAFKWAAETTKGHDVCNLTSVLLRLRNTADGRPKVLIADTIKGRGVASLEDDPLCHVKTLSPQIIDAYLEAEHA